MIDVTGASETGQRIVLDHTIGAHTQLTGIAAQLGELVYTILTSGTKQSHLGSSLFRTGFTNTWTDFFWNKLK